MKHPSIPVIAHRGESYDAPENTLAAINLAWERGAEAVEIDIRLTKDNRIVVFHDPGTKRLAGIGMSIKNHTFEELRKLDVGAWKNAKFSGEKIPSLEEVIETVPPRKKLIIEIKTGPEIIPFLKNELEASGLEPFQTEIIGFDLQTISLAKKAFPKCKVLWLLDLDYYWFGRIFRPSISKSVLKAKKNELDGLNVWAGNMLTPALIHQVKDAGLLLYCWTVNNPEKIKDLLAWGLDGITTDRALWVKSQLGLPQNL